MERRRLSSGREPTAEELRQTENDLRNLPSLPDELLKEIKQQPRPSFTDFIKGFRK